jgi:alpha-L-rhamnosidase
MSQIAVLLGRAEDATRYAELAENARAAWQAEYIDADGRLTPDTQANHVRAIAFDLVPSELRPAVADHLVELIRKADTHLGTGFLATPHLLPVLAETGHLDVAYELLLQNAEPSWLVMVDRGATTVWERWNGVDAAGVPHESLNHYSKGAVISFLHRYTAGIELLEPAYRRFRIRPRPGGGLTRATAVHDSPHGRIESAWRVDGNAFELRVVVPAGTEAEVVLPDASAVVVGPGERRRACTLPRGEAR